MLTVCQLCSNNASLPFDKYFTCIDWSCCKYSTRNSLPVASIVDSSYWCFAITCLACLFFKYVTVRDYKGSPWLQREPNRDALTRVVSSTLHPAWAVLANVHAVVICIRNIFEDLVNCLTRSGLRQWVAGVFENLFVTFLLAASQHPKIPQTWWKYSAADHTRSVKMHTCRDKQTDHLDLSKMFGQKWAQLGGTKFGANSKSLLLLHPRFNFCSNIWIARTLQCHTLTGFLKTTGWIRCVCREKQDFIHLLWTIKVSYVLISLNQNKIGACMYLWYVYARVCGCDLPWGTRHKEPFCQGVFQICNILSYTFRH